MRIGSGCIIREGVTINPGTEGGGLETIVGELDVGYRVTERWSLSAGVRHDEREDDSPVVAVTQEEGARTDGVVQVAYDAGSRWRSYGFAQATLAKNGDREENKRFGLGGAYRLSERTALDGEVSYGDLGPAAKVGTRYQQSDRSQLYLNYSLENERLLSGVGGRTGNLVSGARTRLSDSSSVFLENRYQHSDTALGLTRAMGVTLAPTERYAYVLLEDEEDETRLTAVDVEVVKALGSTTPKEIELSDDALHIDGAGRSLALQCRNTRSTATTSTSPSIISR